ncbi:MAG: ribonuclease H-like domain-containing protein [Anaerovoracaceae bacterium]|jgi:uncharacterized protein YprB with RNaseH-like and TPR domain
MKISNYQADCDIYSSSVFDEYFRGLRVGYFDIESTGLSPRRCSMVLAGLVFPDDGKYIARQYFAEDPEEEPAVIAALLSDLTSLDVIVTYNGCRFDVPFLEKRMEINGMDHVDLPYQLDLYRLVRYHSDIGNFTPNLKQKTLEDFLGLWSERSDEIDGKESVRLYYQWLDTRDEEIREIICLHNRDDILQLARLMAVIVKTDFHAAMTDFGFPCRDTIITDLILRDDAISISGVQTGEPVDYVFYGREGLEYNFSSADAGFDIRAALNERDGVVFADLSPSGIQWPEDPSLVGSLLMLKDQGKVNNRAVNLFARALIERIQESWITEK